MNKQINLEVKKNYDMNSGKLVNYINEQFGKGYFIKETKTGFLICYNHQGKTIESSDEIKKSFITSFNRVTAMPINMVSTPPFLKDPVELAAIKQAKFQVEEIVKE